MRIGIMLAGVPLLAVVSMAAAQPDVVAEGRKVAETSCASCHQIYSDRTTAASSNAGPAFADLARMPTTTELSLKVFLQSSHGAMPNLILTKDERESVAAYILSLGAKAK